MPVDYRTASRKVNAFMDKCRDRALDMLVKHYQDDGNARDMIDTLLEQAESYGQPAPSGPPPQRQHLEVAASPSSLSHHDYPGALSKGPSHQHTPSTGGHNMPSTPPRTASSVKSQGSRAGRDTAEFLLIVSEIEVDGFFEQHKVRFEVASIPHSLIRKSVVERLELVDTVVETDLEYVTMPTSAGHRYVSVCNAAKLTWSYSGRKTTHETIFYVIENDKLDIDVLLGSDDTDKPISEPAHKPQVKSYHRSDYTFGRSTRVIPRRDSSGQQHEQFAQQFAGEMMGEGHTQNSRGQETQQSLRNVRLDGIGESRQVPQSGRATPSPSAQPGSGGTTSDPNAPAGRIRLRIEWESTTINVWLDMDAPGEAFFQAFQKAAGKKHTLERDETSLLLKKDKKSSDKDEYTLLLGADELDADWETTLEWLRNHMAEKPPNIYGKVDVGDR